MSGYRIGDRPPFYTIIEKHEGRAGWVSRLVATTDSCGPIVKPPPAMAG